MILAISQLYDVHTLCLRLSVSRSTLLRMVESHAFPQPLYVTKKCPRWRESDVAAWQEARAAEAGEGGLPNGQDAQRSPL